MTIEKLIRGSEGAGRLSSKKITGDYLISISDQYLISDGGNTLTLPLFAAAVQPVFIVNEGVSNDTINGNGKTVPNGATLSPGVARGFMPGTSEWSEL